MKTYRLCFIEKPILIEKRLAFYTWFVYSVRQVYVTGQSDSSPRPKFHEIRKYIYQKRVNRLIGFDPIISLSRDKTTKKEMQKGSLCWNFCSFLAEHGLNSKHNHDNLPVFCRIKKKYILHIISFMLRISAGNGLESMSQISFVVRFKLVIWWVFFPTTQIVIK